MWKLVTEWRRWNGSVLNAFPQQNSTCSMCFFSRKQNFSDMRCLFEHHRCCARFQLCWAIQADVTGGFEAHFILDGYFTLVAETSLLAAAAQSLCGVRGQPLPCPCGKGLQRQPGFFRYPEGKILAAILMPHLLPSSLLSANYHFLEISVSQSLLT